MKILGIILAVLILAFGMAMLSGWLWMLALGAFSHIFTTPKAAIGYWPSVLVGFLVNLLIGGIFRGSKSE